jgi:hypothetical protein
MSDLENKPLETSEIAELKEQCAGLAQQVRILLYGLVVASFTLTLFLALQARRAGRELDLIQPTATQIAELSKKEEVAIRTFLGQLLEYGKVHSDFAALLQKYKIVTVKAPGAPAPAAATSAPAEKK